VNTLEKLNAWLGADKSRSVRIYHDSGYVASCWVVELIVSGNAVVEEAELTDDGDWRGLEQTILAALEKAGE
jgi:hypothetical protein